MPPIYETTERRPRCVYRFQIRRERSGRNHSGLFLGGAAVYRCDNRLAFSDGFSR